MKWQKTNNKICFLKLKNKIRFLKLKNKTCFDFLKKFNGEKLTQNKTKKIMSAQEVKNASVGDLFLQLSPHDLAYYTAIISLCATHFEANFSGADISQHILHNHFGLSIEANDRTVNIPLVCQLLCARGLRVLECKQYIGMISVRWNDNRYGDKTDIECERFTGIYIPRLPLVYATRIETGRGIFHVRDVF